MTYNTISSFVFSVHQTTSTRWQHEAIIRYKATILVIVNSQPEIVQAPINATYYAFQWTCLSRPCTVVGYNLSHSSHQDNLFDGGKWHCKARTRHNQHWTMCINGNRKQYDEMQLLVSNKSIYLISQNNAEQGKTRLHVWRRLWLSAKGTRYFIIVLIWKHLHYMVRLGRLWWRTIAWFLHTLHPSRELRLQWSSQLYPGMCWKVWYSSLIWLVIRSILDCNSDLKRSDNPQ